MISLISIPTEILSTIIVAILRRNIVMSQSGNFNLLNMKQKNISNVLAVAILYDIKTIKSMSFLFFILLCLYFFETRNARSPIMKIVKTPPAYIHILVNIKLMLTLGNTSFSVKHSIGISTIAMIRLHTTYLFNLHIFISLHYLNVHSSIGFIVIFFYLFLVVTLCVPLMEYFYQIDSDAI